VIGKPGLLKKPFAMRCMFWCEVGQSWTSIGRSWKFVPLLQVRASASDKSFTSLSIFLIFIISVMPFIHRVLNHQASCRVRPRSNKMCFSPRDARRRWWRNFLLKIFNTSSNWSDREF